MQKIVTPNTSPNPIIPTSAPPVVPPITIRNCFTLCKTSTEVVLVPVPIIEVTTKAPVTNAVTKCEEYKHRVKKRASIITYVFGGVSSLGKEFPHMVSAQIVDLNHD
jgi:hypothetical protein